MNKLFSLFLVLIVASVVIYANLDENISDGSASEVVPEVTELPDFSDYDTPREKVENFFNFLLPIVRGEQSKILYDRTKLLEIYRQRDHINLKLDERIWLKQLASQYNMEDFSYKNEADREELLNRVDIVPEKIILSQAALETGWGTSAFAVKANNLFGMHTFDETNGIVPKRREKGQTFLVAKYRSVNQSVRSYLKTINTHRAYDKFRHIRADFRNSEQPFDAYQLVNYLTKYSIEGNLYISKVKRRMKHYNEEIIRTI